MRVEGGRMRVWTRVWKRAWKASLESESGRAGWCSGMKLGVQRWTGAKGCWRVRSGFTVEVEVFEVFVSFFYAGGGFRVQFFEQGEEQAGDRRIRGCDRPGAWERREACRWRRRGCRGRRVLSSVMRASQGMSFIAGVGNDSVEVGIALEGVDGFEAAVGGDDVEFGGFDDELAGGYAAGRFAIDYKKARPDHFLFLSGQRCGCTATICMRARGSGGAMGGRERVHCQGFC